MLKLRSLAVRSFVEPYVPLMRLKHRLKFSKPRIKLIAVAKNEARYLTEWVLHHLYFGIDHIEVHYNQCSDNTVALGEYLAKRLPVSFVNADKKFAPHLKSPQVNIYLSSISKAYQEGYSHILFLDIDEFFVPKDLKTSVPSMLADKSYYDVISTNWTNKLDDAVLFGKAIEQKLSLEVSPTVKSVVKTFVNPPVMNPHNVVSQKLRYGMSGTASFNTDRSDMSKVTEPMERFESADFFVLHRQYRSEIEYVTLLGRGRPIEAAKQKSIFKNNRRGYNIHNNKQLLSFDSVNFQSYTQHIDNWMQSSAIQSFHIEAEKLVHKRYREVIDMIANAPITEQKLLKQLLKNISLNDVNCAFNKMKSNTVN